MIEGNRVRESIDIQPDIVEPEVQVDPVEETIATPSQPPSETTENEPVDEQSSSWVNVEEKFTEKVHTMEDNEDTSIDNHSSDSPSSAV